MSETWLAHHGIKGQKWGLRRFQDTDGSLTAAGRKRYGVGSFVSTRDHKKPFGAKIDGPTSSGPKWGKVDGPTQKTRIKYKKGDLMDTSKDNGDSSITRRVKKDYNELSDEEFKRKYQGSKETYRKRVNKYGDPYMNSPLAKAGKKLAKKKGKNPDEVAEGEINGSVATPKMSEKTKKALKTAAKIGAAAALAGLAAYGAYKGSEFVKKEAGRQILNEGKKYTDALILDSRQWRNRAISEFTAANDYDRQITATKLAPSLLPKEALERQQSHDEKIWTEYRDAARERGKQASLVADVYDRGIRQIKAENKARANEVSGSVVKSAKYLLEQKKKKRS